MKVILSTSLFFFMMSANATIVTYDSYSNDAIHRGSFSSRHAFSSTSMHCTVQNCGGGRSYTLVSSQSHEFNIIKIDDSAPNWSVPLLMDINMWVNLDIPTSATYQDINLSASANLGIFQTGLDNSPISVDWRHTSIRYTNLTTRGVTSDSFGHTITTRLPNDYRRHEDTDLSFFEYNVNGDPLKTHNRLPFGFHAGETYYINYSASTSMDTHNGYVDHLGYFPPWSAGVSAFVDPTIYIDPTWRYANAFEIIQTPLEDGVDLQAIGQRPGEESNVPEPPSLALIFSGVLIVGYKFKKIKLDTPLRL